MLSSQDNNHLQNIQAYTLGTMDMFLCITHEDLSLEILGFWHSTDKYGVPSKSSSIFFSLFISIFIAAFALGLYNKIITRNVLQQRPQNLSLSPPQNGDSFIKRQDSQCTERQEQRAINQTHRSISSTVITIT